MVTCGYICFMTTPWDGSKLKAAREANNQSHNDIAGAFGVWPFTVMRWETNESTPRKKTREKLEAIYALNPPAAVS